MTIPDFEFSTPAGDAVRDNYRRQGATAERERIVERIRAQVCFDALADHDEMADTRLIYPTVVGRCAHHGGKCTDLLLLISELESK